MKVDRLFLQYGQPASSQVRAIIDMNAVVDDSFEGAEGQKLFVFSAQDNDAAADLLRAYGYDDEQVPLLVRHDGDLVRSVKLINLHLRDAGMAEGD